MLRVGLCAYPNHMNISPVEETKAMPEEIITRRMDRVLDSRVRTRIIALAPL